MLIKKGAVGSFFYCLNLLKFFSTDLKPLPQTVRLEG